MSIHFAETTYGFEFGSAKVDRLTSDAKKGWIVLKISSIKDTCGVQIYVTKTGKIRVYWKDQEFIPDENQEDGK